MRQVFQNLKSGEIELTNLPAPKPSTGHVLIGSTRTLLSAGTERMLTDFGKAGWVERARSQPDKVKMVLDKVKTDGLAPTIEAVQSKLDQPMPLGYCNVGRVLSNGSTTYKTGDRVISNGNHAEVVRVPKNLVASIPDEVDDDSATFTVLGSIALQGIRLIRPTLGETVVVTGLGLIGLMAVQILRANGCRVLGIDLDTAKCALAKEFGAEIVDLSKGEDPVQAALAFSRGRGVDGVVITASARSNDIMHQAATMCRKRGRIVLIGVVGLELSRADFYEKELTFQVSCSYGPGRYDSEYEDKGNDYPLPFVRWTEQRNFEAVLDLMADGSLNVKPLIGRRFLFDDAQSAYAELDNRSTLGIILEYPHKEDDQLLNQVVPLSTTGSNTPTDAVNVAFIGSGNYASRVLIPAFKSGGATLSTVIGSRGASAVQHGKKNGFNEASTDITRAFGEKINTVIIATRHNLHAAQAIDAINAGKHLFVEKPLALTLDELDAIESAHRNADNNTHIMVGYNRRFSPHIQKIKELLGSKKVPMTFNMTMNAGDIPSDHWAQDPHIGGGRIIGEACHYIDLMRHLAGSKITSFHAVKMGDTETVSVTEDKAIITLGFENGSVGSIHYFANGGKAFPKERIEVFCDDAVLQLDNFRTLTGFGWRGFNKFKTRTQDKGQKTCSREFIDSIKKGKGCPIPLDEIFEVSRVSVQIADSLR
jgi:predicted dehydrogenase/threonine dehydrogenase-like Zn-dependent dehydrogenase